MLERRYSGGGQQFFRALMMFAAIGGWAGYPERAIRTGVFPVNGWGYWLFLRLRSGVELGRNSRRIVVSVLPVLRLPPPLRPHHDV